jgi:voltage-gated potassium channel
VKTKRLEIMTRSVFETSARTRFYVAVALIGIVSVIGATGFHFIENWPWFDGVYMTLITMTTVGYGEIHELTPTGRIFNTFLILASVMAGGLLIGTFTQAMLEFELGAFLGKRRLERDIARLKNHYIICGAGRVGRTVAREFFVRGIPCLVIEIDSKRAEWAFREGIPILVGSGATEDSLRQARIEHAKGLVAAVTSDPENLYIVLTARGLRPDLPIIARASEEEAISKLKRAGATHVLSPYHFIGHRIVQMVLRPHVIDFIDSAFGSERLDIQIEELAIGEKSPLVGQNLAGSEIRKVTNCIVVALKRQDGEMSFNPPPEETLKVGDHLIAIGSTTDLQKLEALAGSKAYY